MENLEELQMTAGLVLVSSIAMLSIARHCSIDTFLAHKPCRVFGLRWLRWKNIFWIMPAFVFAMMIIGAILVACGWQTWVQDSLGAKPQEAVTLVRETSDVDCL